jgi:hypothetical protein
LSSAEGAIRSDPSPFQNTRFRTPPNPADHPTAFKTSLPQSNRPAMTWSRARVVRLDVSGLTASHRHSPSPSSACRDSNKNPIQPIASAPRCGCLRTVLHILDLQPNGEIAYSMVGTTACHWLHRYRPYPRSVQKLPTSLPIGKAPSYRKLILIPPAPRRGCFPLVRRPHYHEYLIIFVR